jgi:VIT1/CCC1 family predicted Fe2+/Mn2+ transporter
VLLALDCLQIGLAVAAFVRGRRSAQTGAPSHARYSFAHGLLLLGGAVVLAVPVVLGLAGVISTTLAVVVALVLEAVAAVVSRRTVRRLEAAHQARRPGAAY